MFLLSFLPNLLWAQKLFTLEIKSSQHSEILSKLTYKNSFSSTTEREKEIQNILFSLYDNAYLTAEIESKGKDEKDSLKEIVTLKIGEQFKWANLKRGNVDEAILREVNSPLFRRGAGGEAKPFYYKEVRKLQEKIISYCENNGYPFASIKLDSIVISENSLSASLHLQKNNLIKIDSVVNRGNAKISPLYLQSYLGIRNGDLYNEALVKKNRNKD